MLSKHHSTLVQGYQSCTQACGLLKLVEPRDAFLGSLCRFTLSLPDLQAPDERGGSLSPTARGAASVGRTHVAACSMLT